MTGLELYELRKTTCDRGGGGYHCNHWLEGDDDCHYCSEPCWCPDEGEDKEVSKEILEKIGMNLERT